MQLVKPKNLGEWHAAIEVVRAEVTRLVRKVTAQNRRHFRIYSSVANSMHARVKGYDTN